MILSFIVPVYKVEKYLRECVESILCQLNDDCEIILVDDGSPDCCGEICEEYSRNNKNIITIHQENMGLSGARNTGLLRAKGEYIAFVDSDDRIASGAIDIILETLNSSQNDIYFMDVVKLYPDGGTEPLDKPLSAEKVDGKPKMDVIHYLTSQNKYPGAAWSKIYRRSFLENNSIHFPCDRRLNEDLGFTRDCLYKANSFGVIQTRYYEYRQDREGSITNNKSGNNLEGLHLFIKESADVLCINKRAKGSLEEELMSFVAYEYAVLMNAVCKRKMDDYHFLKSYKWVLKFGRNKRIRVIRLLSDCFGISFASKIVFMIRSRKR